MGLRRYRWQRSGRTRRCRRGATAVEFALAAPILVLMIFAAIEFSRVNMLRHTAAEAAYEGARRGIVPGASADDVRTVATNIIHCASASTFTIDVSPATIVHDTPEVSVSVSIPVDANSWGISQFFTGRTLLKTFTLQREKYETVSVP